MNLYDCSRDDPSVYIQMVRNLEPKSIIDTRIALPTCLLWHGSEKDHIAFTTALDAIYTPDEMKVLMYGLKEYVERWISLPIILMHFLTRS